MAGKGIRAAIALFSFLLILAQVVNHIMWRDEIRTWQVCREASGLIDLWGKMRYEGVPVLWYWIVWVLTRLTDDPFLMQFVHVFIATAVIYVVASWSPFSRLAKFIFALGYYPLFEYAAITRNYALVFLFMLIACTLMSQPRIKLAWLTAILFLLSQVSIWGSGFAILLAMTAIARIIWTYPDYRSQIPKMAACVSIVLAGAVLCIIEVQPGPSEAFTGTWLDALTRQRVVGTIAATYQAWVPIPAWSMHFWNSNILNPFMGLQAILGLVLLVSVVAMLLHRPIALGLMVAGMVGLLAFEFRFKGVARHHGHFFMLLVASYWMAQTTPTWRHGFSFDRFRGPMLLALFCISAVAGIGSMVGGLCIPFSGTLAAAEYIKNNVDPKLTIAGMDDYCVSPIAQWLDRDIYFPQMRKFARYNTQNGAERYLVTEVKELIFELADVALATRSDVLLIFSQYPPPRLADADTLLEVETEPGKKSFIRIKVLPSFRQSVVADEGQDLYLISVAKTAEELRN